MMTDLLDYAEINADQERECPECDGTGWVYVGMSYVAPGDIAGPDEPCIKCHGTGCVYEPVHVGGFKWIGFMWEAVEKEPTA